jgi:hypothetical protein
MLTPHQMGDLALDLRTRGSVVRAPLAIGLSSASSSQNPFKTVDGHRTAIDRARTVLLSVMLVAC